MEELSAKVQEAAGALRAKEELKEERCALVGSIAQLQGRHPGVLMASAPVFEEVVSVLLATRRAAHRQRSKLEVAALKAELQKVQLESKTGAKGKDLATKELDGLK